jgi:hypothetical protein
MCVEGSCESCLKSNCTYLVQNKIVRCEGEGNFTGDFDIILNYGDISECGSWEYHTNGISILWIVFGGEHLLFRKCKVSNFGKYLVLFLLMIVFGIGLLVKQRCRCRAKRAEDEGQLIEMDENVINLDEVQSDYVSSII